jgi:predicted hydrolase (HD superfamily)
LERATAAGLLGPAKAERLLDFNSLRRDFRHRGRSFGSDAEREAVREDIIEALYALDLMLDRTA